MVPILEGVFFKVRTDARRMFRIAELSGNPLKVFRLKVKSPLDTQV
jgi:hypothetical protein